MKLRAFVGRRFFQMTAMIVIGIGSLLILKKLGYLDLRPVAEAFRREGHWIGLIVLSLTGLLTLSAIRFYFLVRGLGIDAPFREVLGTNLVGQAVGQWLPGSMAMTEVLRFGVMAGLRPKGDSGRISAGPGPLGRLGLAILVDRLLGLGAMFALGGLAGFYLLIRKSARPGTRPDRRRPFRNIPDARVRGPGRAVPAEPVSSPACRAGWPVTHPFPREFFEDGGEGP